MENRVCKVCGIAKSLVDFHSYVVSGKRYWRHQCRECVKPAVCARKAEWYARDPKRATADSKRWYENNKKRAASSRAQYKANHHEWWVKYHRGWRDQNRTKILAWTRQYQAVKLKAIPRWADKNLILDFYKLARIACDSTGLKFEVDHIVPLRSKQVSGLHVGANLTVMLDTANNAKGNRWWPDMPGT